MGNGLKRVAKQCGGLIARDATGEVRYDADGNRIMKLKEIAAEIDAHLKRFEADPAIKERLGLDCAVCYPTGPHVWFRYSNSELREYISRASGQRYLDFLEAGNVGRHYEALREAKAQANAKP